MDDDETDHTELLKGFTCPDERARAARSFGLVGDEHRQLACAGSDSDALINRAAFEQAQQPRPRPNCGHVDA